MPKIFMIAGPNGAGKTTSATYLLPEILHCDEYVNADAIAAGLSPFKPEKLALQAGRLMLERIYQLAKQEKNFAFETTGASKSFVPFLLNCKKQGYELNLLFLWLKNPMLAIKRVASRVVQGGHDIPASIVKRRYDKGIINLFKLYIPIVDNWALYDNSENHPKLIAGKKEKFNTVINNSKIWQKLSEKDHDKI